MRCLKSLPFLSLKEYINNYCFIGRSNLYIIKVGFLSSGLFLCGIYFPQTQHNTNSFNVLTCQIIVNEWSIDKQNFIIIIYFNPNDYNKNSQRNYYNKNNYQNDNSHP